MFFKDIIGHSEVKTRLIRSVKEGRISHAQLFLGSEGSGNLALALAYAQYITCLHKGEDESCGTCPSCLKNQKLSHPDVHFSFPITSSKDAKIAAAYLPEWRSALLENPYLQLYDWYEFLEVENKQGLIGVEESEDILKKLSLTSYESEYKICLVWMPEKMNHAAANKLLKILEEPPDKTLFILVCSYEDQLLKTIVSRTQLVKIYQPSTADIALFIEQKYNLAAADAEKIALLAENNYSKAIKLAQEDHSSEENLNLFRDWMRLCFKNDVPSLVRWANDISDMGREKQKNFLGHSINILRNAILLNFANGALVNISTEEQGFLEKYAPFITPANCIDMVNAFEKAITHIERNANPKLLFLDLSLSCIRLIKMKEKASQIKA